MNRSEVVKFIGHLEKNYPINEWVIQDIHIWPVLKSQIFFVWFERAHSGKSGNLGATSKKSKNGVRDIFLSCIYWIRFELQRVGKTRFVFSGADSHRAQFSDQYMNRYFDPIMDFLETQKDKPVMFEQNRLGDKPYAKRHRLVDLRMMFPLVNVIIKIRNRKRVVKSLGALRGFEECLREVEQVLPEIPSRFMRNQMAYMIQTVLVWAALFDRLFSKLKPRYAFGLCYYTLQMMGMNVSARRKNVVSVDMQHGTQGDLHVAYAEFSRIPINGYAVLPQVFWCWDETSAATIRKWVAKQEFHRVEVGGNPWLTYLLNESIEYKKLSTNKKIVLYTMQPVEPLLDDYLIQAMKITSSQYEWWLRLHPRQMNERSRLEEILAQSGLRRQVNIDDACSLPLPIILRRASVHISKFSGSIIEASLLGVRNIIIDEIGTAAFESEIVEGRAIAFLQRDAKAFAALLSEAESGNTGKVSNIDFRDVLKNY